MVMIQNYSYVSPQPTTTLRTPLAEHQPESSDTLTLPHPSLTTSTSASSFPESFLVHSESRSSAHDDDDNI